MDQMSFTRNAKFWGIRFTKEFLDAHKRQNKILTKICKIIRKMLIAGEIADIYKKGQGIYVVLSDGSQLTKAQFKNMLSEKYNVFESQGESASQTEGIKRGLVTYTLERFLGYGTRNNKKKIPKIRIHGKSFYLKDTSAKVDVDNKTLTVPTLYGKCTMNYKYSLKEDLFLEKQNAGKCTGGNIVIRQGCYIAAVEVSKPLLYKPVGVSGTDFNKSPQDWVCLNDDQKISLPDDIGLGIDEIRELNTYLDTDKKKKTHERQYKSKERRPKRLAWKEEHKKVKNAIYHVVLKIVQKAIDNKLLIAIDSVQTGASSGTFGQDHLIKLFQTECENRGVPFYVVPCKNTSRRCSRCGNIDEHNRVSTSDFICTNPECFAILDAQLNGAINVAYVAERMYFGIDSTEDTFISNLFEKLDERQCIIPYGNYHKRNVDNLINSYKEKQVELPLADV